ncbi:inositol monophosphatase family protein [Pelagicoccus sp. SDUM812005]|uniref:inositol monophosphatase family protein n=1 Tax=Pelagicoccus sp. SDUM812005 TaxID=3041257 RepID=UPI00280DEA30|nr:inositol monophosphatase family protein [Pelagicoccus sp. SDUM812005]MDQ8180988.1 inositol monophosphatase family protein [Pelagicoccus sp. SDUM812005]
MQFEEFDAFTGKLCKETERIILEYFESPDLEVDSKGDDTPVTEADRKTEQMIRDAIETLYPDHGIMGEEFGNVNESADYQWVIDPIDGTKTFAAGAPLFGTMIALLKDGEPLFGTLNYPAIHKRICGDNQRAFCNAKPIKARTGVPLSEAIVLTTDVQSIPRYQNGPNFEELLGKTKFCRTWGDCFGYFLVATGKADIMLDPILNPWDIMALVPVLRGSGAVITDWYGGNPAKGESCIASNSDLHESVVQTLNQ